MKLKLENYPVCIEVPAAEYSGIDKSLADDNMKDEVPGKLIKPMRIYTKGKMTILEIDDGTGLKMIMVDRDVFFDAVSFCTRIGVSEFTPFI